MWGSGRIVFARRDVSREEDDTEAQDEDTPTEPE